MPSNATPHRIVTHQNGNVALAVTKCKVALDERLYLLHAKFMQHYRLLV